MLRTRPAVEVVRLPIPLHATLIRWSATIGVLLHARDIEAVLNRRVRDTTPTSTQLLAAELQGIFDAT